jgi:hypothetical protein
MPKVLWTQKNDVGPSWRGGHAIAYDRVRQRVVLFGGTTPPTRARRDRPKTVSTKGPATTGRS